MRLPNQFNDIIKKHLNVYAAWLPVTNNFKIGDYGIFSDGVFIKMGNISEFNVSFNEATGPDAKLDFTSTDTKVIRFAAGAEVDVIPAGSIDAKITFKFSRERSFLIKIPIIKVHEIQNIQQVANQLKTVKGWQKKWKVVFQTYDAKEPVIISTIAAGTELTFGGDVNALRELKLGSADVEFGSTKELGLNIQGKEGIVGLGLFKLNLLGGGINILSDDEKQGEASVSILSPEDTDL